MLNRTESVRCRISGQGRTFGRGEPGVRDSYSNGHMSYSYSMGWETVAVMDTSHDYSLG